jgi:hypothetical protein
MFPPRHSIDRKCLICVRSCYRRVLALNLQRSSADYHTAIQPVRGEHVIIVDGNNDVRSWDAPPIAPAAVSESSDLDKLATKIIELARKETSTTTTATAPSTSPSSSSSATLPLMIDSLPNLILRHSSTAVVKFLHTLNASGTLHHGRVRVCAWPTITRLSLAQYRCHLANYRNASK